MAEDERKDVVIGAPSADAGDVPAPEPDPEPEPDDDTDG